MNPHWDLAPAFLAPLIETVSGNNATASIYKKLEGSSSVSVLALAFIIRLPMEGSAAQEGINPPVHEPALVAAFVVDNDGNVGGSLRRDVKTGCIVWEILVEVPANPYVTKLKRSCEATAHNESTYSAGYSGRSKSFVNPSFAGCFFSFHRVVFQSVLL